MRRLAVILAMVLAGIGLFVARPRSQPAVRSAPPPAPVVRPPTLPAPPLVPLEPPPAAEEPRPEPLEPPSEVALQLEGARAAILRAARPCLEGRASAPPPAPIHESAQEVQLRFHVLTQEKLAMVTDVERLESRIADAALERCILDAAAGVAFAADVEDDHLTATLTLYVSDLMQADPLFMPPPPVPPPTSPPPR